MQHITFLTAALAAVVGSAAAQSVSGSPEGFAAGTTGGAAGETVTPSSTDELVSYLAASEAYTILITQEFDFTGTEGTTTETGCAPWGTDSACQLAINANDWCGNYEAGAGSVEVSYDNAGTTPIDVASDKTILGVGSNAVIKGKGLRLANGVSNIIVQNIAITELNPQYVWGGDAITLDGSSNVWIDHVKISLIGRMFIVTGYNANTAVTVSNCEFDGQTSWSASCDGYHYWTQFFTGDGDQITFKNNYVHHTSGILRSPISMNPPLQSTDRLSSPQAARPRSTRAPSSTSSTTTGTRTRATASRARAATRSSRATPSRPSPPWRAAGAAP